MTGKISLIGLLLIVTFLTACATATTSSTPGGQSKLAPHIYNKNYNNVFLAAIDAASAMGWQVTFTDQTTGIISASTPTNLWTWGDTVSVRVSKIDEDRVEVDVSSGTSRQVFDWGRNERNILNFYGKLDSLIYSKGD
jgi:hypothetical protein